MLGRTHELIGVGCGALAAHALNLEPAGYAALVGAAFVTSKLPDRLECGFIPHRTVTHSAPVAIAFAVAGAVGAVQTGAVLATLVVCGLVAGYWLHLAADACTPHGIPGWPVCERVWILPRDHRIATGSRRESGFVALWIIACGLVFIAL